MKKLLHAHTNMQCAEAKQMLAIQLLKFSSNISQCYMIKIIYFQNIDNVIT